MDEGRDLIIGSRVLHRWFDILLLIKYRTDCSSGAKGLLQSVHVHLGELNIVEAPEIRENMINAFLQDGQLRFLPNLFLSSGRQDVHEH